MASKRTLKRDLINQVTALFNYALELRSLVVLIPDQAEPLEGIIDDIMIFTDDSIRRIGHTDGAHNPALVRAYYRDLRASINTTLVALEGRLDAVLNSLVITEGESASDAE